MRRPEGFDRPEQPPTRGGTPSGAAATPGGRGTKRSSRRPADSNAPAAAARSRGTTDGTRTEPITLPTHEPERPHLASVSPLHTPVARTADPVTEPIATVSAKTPGVRVPKAGVSDAEPDIAHQTGERAEPALTPATARRRFRAARRARKRYEREEVRRFTWRSRRRRTVWLTVLGTVAALVGFVLVGA